MKEKLDEECWIADISLLIKHDPHHVPMYNIHYQPESELFFGIRALWFMVRHGIFLDTLIRGGRR